MLGNPNTSQGERSLEDTQERDSVKGGDLRGKGGGRSGGLGTLAE